MPVLSPYHRSAWSWRPTAHAPRPGDWALLPLIRQLAESLVDSSDGELSERQRQLRETSGAREQLYRRDRLATSFALTLEAIRRTTGCVYYDVQLLAGLALARGAVVEMKTGEGKTLVAALPAALHALVGEGVHVATVNRYLAERDFELLRRPLSLLGFSVGLVTEQSRLEVKRAAYGCDITYSTGYELGFDFLRDQLWLRSRPLLPLGETWRRQLRGRAMDTSGLVQRALAFAIIDEVDSVLIDEANTPLVLSQGESSDPDALRVYAMADKVAASLRPEVHFHIDRRSRSIILRDEGLRRVYANEASVPDRGLCRPWATYVEQALRARHMLQPEVDYVIRDGKVQLVDAYTGRIFADRHWRDGLHQAVEHRAGVEVTPEKLPLARISRQRYFGLYHGLCGMSGTCVGHEPEFYAFYRLPVVVVPERFPSRRQQLPTRYFPHGTAKEAAIVEEIAQRHQRGQPLLVGTRTIAESRRLALRLSRAGIAHRLLNGLQDAQEALLVAAAGELGAVTIATNMAGRGTDIPVTAAALDRGGLHVMATQRQESARVDRQLIGRAARQGQPGSCQFFVAADDQLFAQYGGADGEKIAAACQRGMDRGPVLDRWTATVQRRAEQETWLARQELFALDAANQEMMLALAGAAASVPRPAEEALP